MEKDVSWGMFFEDDRRFADLVNQIGCNGVPTVTAQDVEREESKLYGEQGKRSGKTKYSFLTCDSIRRVVCGVNFVIVDVESQENVDFSYPLRDMGYTYRIYERQARNIRKSNQERRKKLKNGEYLYRFTEEDRLNPTAVFLIYSGKEEWKGPLDIYGMLDFKGIPESLKDKVQNHKINLIDLHRMKDEDFVGFQTDVGKVFQFIRYSEDKEKLGEIVRNDEYYQNMDKEAYAVAKTYANIKEIKQEEEYRTERGGMNMCTAIREMIEEGRAEGRVEGREQLLTANICKKLRKNKTIDMITEELEEEESTIQKICDIAKAFAPEYDEEKVFEAVKERKGCLNTAKK